MKELSLGRIWHRTSLERQAGARSHITTSQVFIFTVRHMEGHFDVLCKMVARHNMCIQNIIPQCLLKNKLDEGETGRRGTSQETIA
jgi:hypothetical protein